MTWEFLRVFFPFMWPKTDILIFSVVDTQMLELSEAESSVFASGTTSDWNLSFVCQSSVTIFSVNVKCISQLTLKVKLQETSSFSLMRRGPLRAHETLVMGLHTPMCVLTQVYTSLKRSIQSLTAGGLSKLCIIIHSL